MTRRDQEIQYLLIESKAQFLHTYLCAYLISPNDAIDDPWIESRTMMRTINKYIQKAMQKYNPVHGSRHMQRTTCIMQCVK
jgi:hypothetical protein